MVVPQPSKACTTIRGLPSSANVISQFEAPCAAMMASRTFTSVVRGRLTLKVRSPVEKAAGRSPDRAAPPFWVKRPADFTTARFSVRESN